MVVAVVLLVSIGLVLRYVASPFRGEHVLPGWSSSHQPTDAGNVSDTLAPQTPHAEDHQPCTHACFKISSSSTSNVVCTVPCPMST